MRRPYYNLATPSAFGSSAGSLPPPEWNQIAHPFKWTMASFDKILAKTEAALQQAA